LMDGPEITEIPLNVFEHSKRISQRHPHEKVVVPPP